MAYSFAQTLHLGITVVTLFSYLFFAYKYAGSLKQNLIGAYIFGFLYNLYTFSFFYETYPLPWFEAGFLQILIIILVHLITSAVSALSYILVGYILYVFKEKNFLLLIYLPLSFVFSEILRSILISIMYLGRDTDVGVHWIQGSLGAALSYTPLVEISYIGGVFGLTWALTQIVSALFFHKKITLSLIFVLLPFFVVFAVHQLAPIYTPTQNINVLAFSTNFNDENIIDFNQEFKKRNNLIYEEINKYNDSPIDIIVLPEDSRFLSYSSPTIINNVKKIMPEALLIDGDTIPSGASYRNYTLFYDINSDTTLGRGKIYISPYSEYMPFIFKIPLKLLTGKETYSNYARTQNYSSDKGALVYESPLGRVGTMICGEIMSQKTIDSFKNQRPNIMFVQSYLSVFKKGNLYSMNFVSHLQILAATLRVPVIASTNQGPSLYLNHTGKIIADFSSSNEAHSDLINVDKIKK